jgi:hypothetical protein
MPYSEPNIVFPVPLLCLSYERGSWLFEVEFVKCRSIVWNVVGPMPNIQLAWKVDDFVLEFAPLAKVPQVLRCWRLTNHTSVLCCILLSPECMKDHLEEVEDSDLLAVPTWQDVIALYLIVQTNWHQPAPPPPTGSLPAFASLHPFPQSTKYF